jgi:hypothetical protein
VEDSTEDQEDEKIYETLPALLSAKSEMFTIAMNESIYAKLAELQKQQIDDDE